MEVTLNKGDLLKLYENFNIFCDATVCNDCKYSAEEECFVSYVFDKDRCIITKDESVSKSDIDSYYKVTVDMVNGNKYSCDVNSNYFFELKRYVISIRDKNGKGTIFNIKRVKRVSLSEYSKEGILLNDKVIWSK